MPDARGLLRLAALADAPQPRIRDIAMLDGDPRVIAVPTTGRGTGP